MNVKSFTQYLYIFLLISSAVQLYAGDSPWGPKIIKLGDITISCEAYEKYYRDIVEDAAKNNSPKWNAAAKSRLDEAFGTYKTAWIKSSDWIMDMYGKKLPTHKSIHDIKCFSHYDNNYYNNNNSDYNSADDKWHGGNGSYVEKRHVYDKIRLGYIDDCKIKVTQDIWSDLGKCGTGTIIRNFTIGVWCDYRDYTLKLTQKIHVVPSCSFSKEMLHVPDVQWMCGPIKYEDNNHIWLPDFIKPVTLHGGWESSCHSSKDYVSYYDKMYKLIQEHRKYVIIRTWVFSDYCTGKKIEASQKIMVDGTCRDEDWDGKPDEPDKPDKPDEPDMPEQDTVQYSLLSQLDDIYISHEAYIDTYKGIVDLALDSYRRGQTELSAELLNAIFGQYNIQSDTVNVDSVTVYSKECNNGSPIDTDFRIKNGVLQSDCPDQLTISQKLREEFTNCGATGLQREFVIESKCDSVVMRDTFIQHIIFSPTCALTSDVFAVPSDTVLCGKLTTDGNGRIVLPVDDQPVYKGDSMRNFEVKYKFIVSYSSEDPDRTEVSRIWTYTDTCAEENTMITQQLVLLDTCKSELEKAMAREIIQSVSRENIEWGISEKIIISQMEEKLHSGEEPFAYPNPFNQTVGVHFYHENQEKVEINVLDNRGEFRSKRSFNLDPGQQQIYLSGDLFKVPGMYILQLVSGDYVKNVRVIYQP